MPKFVGFVRNASVYQGLGNRFIDAHVRRTRSQTGLELFDRHDGFEPVIELLRSGGGVGVLSDQHAGDHGIWTPFFGRLASTSPLPALLARRTRAAMTPEERSEVHQAYRALAAKVSRRTLPRSLLVSLLWS